MAKMSKKQEGPYGHQAALTPLRHGQPRPEAGPEMGPWAGADGFLRGAEIGRTCGHGGCAGALQRDRPLWLHAPFAELSPCAIDPRVREVVMLRFRQTVQAALALGIRRIVVHSGYIPLVYFPEWFTARSVEFWREFLRGAPDGLCLALENVMEPGPDMLVQIAAGVDDPRFGLCLDVGHANTRVSETPPLDWIAPMAPWLRHVHLHNNDGDWDLHDVLGQGMIPMPDILAALAELSPAADYTIENQNCEPVPAWLARGAISARSDL